MFPVGLFENRGPPSRQLKSQGGRQPRLQQTGTRSHSVGRVLNHDHRELSVRRNHDLVDGGADFDKGDVFLGVQRLDRVRRLVHKLSDQRTVIYSLVLLHSALDGDTFLVDNDDTEDTHVGVDAVQRFFDFLGRCHASPRTILNF